MMLTYPYLLLAILISTGIINGYKRNYPREEWDYDQPEAMYDEYDNYDYQLYGKDSDAGSNNRPSIFSYWNNFLKRTRMPSWNITNPFAKLFTPYVIKVDFPPGTDPNVESPVKNTNNRNKKKKQPQEDYVYVDLENSDVGNPQFFYDPLTQQYYEVQQTNSQDYNPQNNFYATTFNDNDEIVINLDDNNKEQDRDEDDVMDSEEQEKDSYSDKTDSEPKGRFNSPTIRKLKTKQVGMGRKPSYSYRRSPVYGKWVN